MSESLLNALRIYNLFHEHFSKIHDMISRKYKYIGNGMILQKRRRGDKARILVGEDEFKVLNFPERFYNGHDAI